MDRSFHRKFLLRFSFVVFSFSLAAFFLLWLGLSTTTTDKTGSVLVKLDRQNLVRVQKQKDGEFKVSPHGEAYHKVDPMDIQDFYAVFGMPFVILIGFLLFLLFLFGKLYSVKISGPLYRFEKTLEEYNGGHLPPPIKLRKGDELNYLAELINEALDLEKKSGKRVAKKRLGNHT